MSTVETSRTEMRRTVTRRRTTRAAKAGRRAPVGTIIAAVVALGLIGAFLAMPLFGLKMYVITGGSMEGTISRGALILAETVPVSSLEVGDIITYRPPQKSAYVTHRIISVDRQTDGRTVFRTKGDYNETEDPWLFTLDHPQQPKYVGQIPYLGYAIASLDLPIVRAFLLAIPGLIIALVLFFALWRRAAEPRWIRGPGTVTPEAEYPADPQRHPVEQYRRVDRRRGNRRR